LLAQAVRKKKLFDLDQINWAFVRPKTPQERPLAYAQSHWMVQYITETHGHDAVVQLLGLYRQGTSNKDAIEMVTGRPADKFMAGFRQWAGAQVKQWGMDKQPFDKRIGPLLSQEDQIDGDVLESLMSQYPDHPDLLRLAAERALASADYDAARAAVLRYADARPVDPWSSKALVRLALRDDRVEDAVGPLEQLDRSDVKSSHWARELARLHRAAGRLDQAAAAATRALYREPYNAAYRELAAAIDVQRGKLNGALHHVRALTLLEPHRSHQWVRLAALHHRMGDFERAKEAAKTAKQLDPEAPIQRFLK
jgi:tetratricopeptide (TPR) repeat protein